jgi:hypothetical protein
MQNVAVGVNNKYHKLAFDLKGSIIGRRVKVEKNYPSLMKDVNFLEINKQRSLMDLS